MPGEGVRGTVRVDEVSGPGGRNEGEDILGQVTVGIEEGEAFAVSEVLAVPKSGCFLPIKQVRELS